MSGNQEGESTTVQTILSCVIFFGTIGVVVALVWLNKRPQQEPDEKKSPLVEYVSVQKYDKRIKINVTGVTMPFREVTMTAEVTGGITEKTEACRAGTYVEKGTHLLSIDSEKYRLAKDRAEKEIEDAKARHRKAELELKNARTVSGKLDQDLQFQQTEATKRKELYDEEAISQTEYLQSQRNLIAAENASSNQQNKVATLEADLKVQKNSILLKQLQFEEALLDFNKATINAPSDGVVISDDVQEDDFVQVGKNLLVFEDTSAIEVKCDLRSDQLQAVLESQKIDTSQQNRFDLPKLKATIRYEANGVTYVWDGELDRYDGLGLDERTRTAPVRIVVKDTLSKSKNKTLVRGMYVSIELDLGTRPGLLALPAEAVRAGNVVWFFDREGATSDSTDDKYELGKLRTKTIKVVDRVAAGNNREWVVAKADAKTIQAGLNLIISPIPQPVDGMDLRSNGELETKVTERESSGEDDTSVNERGKQTTKTESDGKNGI